MHDVHEFAHLGLLLYVSTVLRLITSLKADRTQAYVVRRRQRVVLDQAKGAMTRGCP